MSGSNLPYQLRLKKNVERHLFIELLNRLQSYKLISEYSYISLGGPFLEDFKLVHNYFDLQDLYSIEMEPYVIERQSFNQSISCIKLLNMTTSEFIKDFPILSCNEISHTFNNSIICWLDFTNINWGEQINEFNQLIANAKEDSVIKITINAHISSLLSAESLPLVLDKDGNILKERPIDKNNRLKKERFNRLKDKLGRFFLDTIEEKDMVTKKFPAVLLSVLKYAAFKALEGTEFSFSPLNSFVYADGMSMLTYTGIILHKDKNDEFKEKVGEWNHFNTTNSPEEIDVPNMSISEKLYIDSHLPTNIDALYKNTKFKFVECSEKNKIILNNYLKYYRFYPNFSKISY